MGMLTVAMLKKHTETVIRLPALSAAEGADVELRCRWIGREEYLGLMPPAPPGSDSWTDMKAIEALPEKEREAARVRASRVVAEKAEAWFRALPTDVQQRREAQARDVLYAVVALAALEPTLTVEQARQLGGDAETAAVQILRASGILKPVPVQAEVSSVAQEAPVEAALAAVA